jgi:hypothetical protein
MTFLTHAIIPLLEWLEGEYTYQVIKEECQYFKRIYFINYMIYKGDILKMLRIYQVFNHFISCCDAHFTSSNAHEIAMRLSFASE